MPEVREPEWLSGARILEADAVEDSNARPPRLIPLAPWARLWPLLRAALAHWTDGYDPDVAQVMRRLSDGRALRRLPLIQRRRWCPAMRLLVDFPARTTPFHGDYKFLRETLEKLRGQLGLTLEILESEPGANPLVRSIGRGEYTDRWQAPSPDVPVLILSDLGLYEPGGTATAGWLAFGRRLRALGIFATVLCPVPRSKIPKSLCRFYRIFSWDRNAPLRLPVRGVSAVDQADVFDPSTQDQALRLLGLLAPALVAEAADVRAVRYLLPAGTATTAVEALLWRNETGSGSAAAETDAESRILDRVVAHDQGLYVSDLSSLQSLRHRFVTESSAGLRRRAIELLKKHHAYWPASMRYAEFEDIDQLLREAGEDPSQPGRDWLAPHDRKRFEDWKRDIVRTVQEHPESTALQQWLRADIGRQDPAHGPAWHGNPARAARWVLAQRAETGALRLPAGVAPETVEPFLPKPEPSARRLRWLQRGQRLWIDPGGVAEDSGDAPQTAAPAFLLAGSIGGKSLITMTVEWVESFEAQHWIAPVPKKDLDTGLELNDSLKSLRVETATERLLIEPVTLSHFPGVDAIGRDGQGLYLKVRWLGREHRMDWRWGEDAAPGHWSGDKEDRTIPFSGGVGYDRFGLYADLRLKNLTQRFRWMNPGRFIMGSVETEAERYDSETQHPVTLSQGYWLADTACTQAMWTAVIGETPSRFQNDPNNPVERVSWDDVQNFIARLNERVPELNARLPTEAEWEYACRAGTATPFSFGENITPDQVNYNGEYPYADGQKGLSRGKTVPVKSLPPNPWGLYEMHGSVWEWCNDWSGDYPAGEVTDPTGPPEGASRVLRGGSWINIGGFARSAHRYGSVPGYRNGFIGFRLALGRAAERPEAGARSPSA